AVQGAGLVASVGGSRFHEFGFGTGVGFEGQVRLNPSRFSLGAGLQFSSHSGTEGNPKPLHLLGVFIEPRIALPTGGRVRPYLAGRVSYLRQSSAVPGINDLEASGLALGGGAGM